jgi:collagenase-like PrtC family protease
MPLAYSARCFTARAYNLPKDNCQYRCLDDANGMMMATREGEDFLCLNGIQTQSALSCNLLGELANLQQYNVDVLRISPQSCFTADIIQGFYQQLTNHTDKENMIKQSEHWSISGSCDGYWHGEAGLTKNNHPPF